MYSPDHMNKQASMPILKGGWQGLKYLAGFGKGGAVSRAVGGGLGYGAIGAYSAEEGLENKLKGFAGGFASGLAFSGAGAAASKGLRGLNRSYAAGARNLSAESKALAKTLDSQKKQVYKMTQQQNRVGASKYTEADRLSALQKSFSENQKAYKALLKSQNVGIGTQAREAVLRNAGTVTGFGVGMGGGMYLSGAVAKPFEDSQRKLIYSQNNVFNPVGSFRG